MDFQSEYEKGLMWRKKTAEPTPATLTKLWDFGVDFQSEYAHINNGPSSLVSTNNIVKPKHRLQHPITQTKNINRVIKHQRLYNSSTINTIRTNMQLLAIPNTRFHLKIPSKTSETTPFWCLRIKNKKLKLE